MIYKHKTFIVISLLLFTMMGLNGLPVYAQTSVVASTSFENEIAAVTTYVDVSDPSIDHLLINNGGQPLVNSTASSTNAGDLGFTSRYFSTQGASSPGLSDGDLVGVTSDTTHVSSYDNGAKGLRLNDPDGRVEVRFAPVTYTSGQPGRTVSVAVYIRSTGNTWEAFPAANPDRFSLYIEDGAGNTVALSGATNANGFIDIDTLTTNNWFNATLNISEAIAGGNLVGDTFTLVFSLEANSDDEIIYIDDVVFSSNIETTPPTVLSRDPNDNDNGVSITTTLDMVFSEFVKKASSGTIEIVETGVGTFESYDLSNPTDSARISVNGDTVSINPLNDLAEETTYHVIIPAGAITDLQNNAFAGYTTTTAYNFTTGDSTPPVLLSLLPADDSVDLSTDISGTQNLRMSFNEQVGAGAGYIRLYKASDDSLIEEIDITTSRVDFYLNSPTDGGFYVDLQVAWEDGTRYYVQLDPGAVVDAANTPNTFPGITDKTTWNFGTFPTPSETPTDTPTDTPTATDTPTETATPTATETPATQTPTDTPSTETPTATETPSETPVTQTATPEPSPTPAAPQSINADPRQGRPLIQWDNDLAAQWYQVYISSTDYTVTLLDVWLKQADICTETGCQYAPDINPLAGDYIVWIQAWGNGQFSTGGNSGFEGWSTVEFSLPSTPPGDITSLTATQSENKGLTLTWVAPDAATWYQIWVGTNGESTPPWEPQFYDWAIADNLGCVDGGVCTLASGVEVYLDPFFDVRLPSGNYVWYVRPWGPGGFSTGGLAGAPGWFQGPDIMVP